MQKTGHMNVTDWKGLEPDLRQLTAARLQAYDSRMSVDDVLENVFVLASRHFDRDRATLRDFCFEVGREVIINDVRQNPNGGNDHELCHLSDRGLHLQTDCG
jgi:hypothetical protein